MKTEERSWQERLVDVAYPRNISELTDFLEKSNSSGKAVYPGQLFHLPESPARSINYELRLDNMKAVLEHSKADQVICVEAGMRLDDLQVFLKANSQFFPAYSKNPSISLLDLINGGHAGPPEHGFRPMRDLILGLSLALADGTVINCGGRVVKNVSGYDLTKLIVGARGSLGVVLSAHLRLFAKPEASSTVFLAFPTIREGFERAARLRQSGLPLSCLELIDTSLLEKNGSELASFADNFPFKETRQFACLIAAQIQGQSTVLKELLHTVITFSGDRAAAIKLEDNAEAPFWQAITDLDISNNDLDVCAPVKFMETFLSSPGNLGEQLYWSARPNRNRLKLRLKNKESKTGCFERLQEESKKLDSPVTVASCDENFLYRVYRFPAPDSALDELKHRLKKEYDPNGILNPLVRL